MDKLHREIDVLLFDRVNILGLAGPVKAFKFALIAKKWAYGLRFVSVDGQAVQAGGGGLFWADCGGACALQVEQEWWCPNIATADSASLPQRSRDLGDPERGAV
jgi:transcriptional regulator GlxA family with amidase domain